MTRPRPVRGPADQPAAGRSPRSALSGDGFYLRQFDLFRAVTCICVVAQHSVLWPVPGGAPVGWGMVMVLHFTRNAFFFLSAFVAAYSQRTRPRAVGALWYRRITQILVPYLVWTAIYFTYTVASTSMSPGNALHTLGTDLYRGYYQLYFLVVLLQMYVLLPGLLWLVRKTRGHHWTLLGASFALQMAMATFSRYFSSGPGTGVTGDLHQVASVLLQSRLIVGYQLLIFLGLVAADHVDEVQRFVARYSLRIVGVTVVVLLATLGFYAYSLSSGLTPGRSADLYQPVAYVWFVAAIAGLYALGWRWAQRAARRPSRTVDRVVTWGSDMSGGIYLSHVLFLQLVLTVLGNTGFRNAVPWGATSAVLFAGTVAVTAVVVSVLLRTPLRWALTGPDRTEERATLRWAPPPAPAPLEPVPAAAVTG